MFLDLIKLYKNNPNKTPLEDFNTECFANILRLYKDIKLGFISNFLKLPEDDYRIRTQLRKDLSNNDDDSNCIIDMVIEGSNTICFIENKIESREGFQQLERYSKALDHHFKEHEKHLCYCTKYSEVKNQDGKYNFKQFKWYEVAKFLKKYEKDNPLVAEYLKFLTQYKMAQDNTFRAEHFLSMENMKKTLEIIDFHLEGCKEDFIRLFGKNAVKDEDQSRTNNRICCYKEGVLETEKTAWSEILYAIELDTLKLSTQMYVDKKHTQYEKFLEAFKNYGNSFEPEYFDNLGTRFYLEEDLGKYLNDKGSDEKIKKWFVSSFEKFDKFKKKSQLAWINFE